MKRTYHLRLISRFAAVVTGLAAALVAFATPAFAVKHPETWVPSAPSLHIHTVVIGGMPGWQIALIAVGAALFAAIVAVLLERARTARKLHTATA
jgi:hypothetical protein